MKEQIVQLLNESDTLAVVGFIAGQDAPPAVLKAAAAATFAFSARCASVAGSKEDESLANAFSALVEHLAKREADGAALARAVEELKTLKDGAFYAGQVTTALEVFGAPLAEAGSIAS